jgi:hypothetical protein
MWQFFSRHCHISLDRSFCSYEWTLQIGGLHGQRLNLGFFPFQREHIREVSYLAAAIIRDPPQLDRDGRRDRRSPRHAQPCPPSPVRTSRYDHAKNLSRPFYAVATCGQAT